MARRITVDPSVHDLAASFLNADSALFCDADVDNLAQDIQRAIEDWFAARPANPAAGFNTLLTNAGRPDNSSPKL